MVDGSADPGRAGFTVIAGHLAAIGVLVGSAACAGGGRTMAEPHPMNSRDGAALEHLLRERIAGAGGEVSVVVIVPAGGVRVGIADTVVMHAASTMKVPVMLEAYRQAGHGTLSLGDSIEVTTRFRSIAADTSYELTPESDSDSSLYGLVGRRVPIRELIRLMIVRSSNLALNLLIDRVGAASVRTTLSRIGAEEMNVRRGVEDLPAFRAGLNNTTTARGFAAVLAAILSCSVTSREACDEMIGILAAQEFDEMIPAGLPAGTRVAHKTGWITGIRHDGGIVYGEGMPAYILVILTRGFGEPSRADALGAEISGVVWSWMTAAATSAAAGR